MWVLRVSCASLYLQSEIIRYYIVDQVHMSSSEHHFCLHCSKCVIRTQWEAPNCIQFPLTSLCLLTRGPDEEWGSSGSRENHRHRLLLTSRGYFPCAMNNTAGSHEVDWLHLWSLSSDNVLPLIVLRAAALYKDKIIISDFITVSL